jgi:putative MATE family efflux protein
MGNMLFDRQQLKKLLVPLVIEQTLAISMGLFDTLMVSSCGEAAVSGVSLVDSISLLLIQILSALATGGAVVCSQYLGKKLPEQARISAGQLMLIMIVTSVAVMVTVLFFYRFLLVFIFGAIDQDVMTNAEIYFVISAISYPFLGVYNAGASLFRAIGNSKISMYTSLVMNILNIGGNAILIYGFGMAVKGAALATLFSRIMSAIVMVSLLLKRDNPLCIAMRGVMKPRRSMIVRILRIGIPSGVENGMFHIGKLLVASLAATFGTASIAANAVSANIGSFANIPGNAIGLAMVTVVGQCIGAGEKKQAKYYSKILLRLAFAGMILADIVLFIIVRPLVSCFGLSQEAIDIAVRLLRTFSVCASFIWPLSFTVPNALRAAGDAKYTMLVSVFSMWIFRVASSYFFAGTLGMGVMGVWIGMYVDWAFRALLFTIRYIKGKWLEKCAI